MSRNQKSSYSIDLRIQQQKQKQMQAEIDRLNNVLKLFIYSTSHDLRAPIMSIKGLVNLMQKDPAAKQNEHYLQLIHQVIDTHDLCLQNYREFLQISDIELNAEIVNFEELINESYHSLKYLDSNKNIKKLLEIRSNDYPFKTDLSYLKIIIQNLVSNAIKFQKKNEPEKYIKAVIEVNQRQCCIEIIDNGISIDTETEQKMFNMFYRGDNGNHGSGLGLYIVRKLLQNMNGYIVFDQKCANFKSFKVILPNLI